MKTKTTTTMLPAMLLTSLVSFAAEGDNTGEVERLKRLEAAEWSVPELGLKMKRIPAGEFIMGSPADETCRRADEAPHRVTLAKPFYMGVYEVTQREFYKLMMPPDYDYDAWQFKRGPIADGAAFCFRYPTRKGLIFKGAAGGGKLTDLNPMECVTWDRAMRFCDKLTEIEERAGRLPAGYVYRLPTEAEWEYACRAGTRGPYNVEANYTTIASIRKFAWVDDFNWVNFGTRAVGTRTPNAWGLYDMHGNVYEWCFDWYGPYAKGPVTDPTGPATGEEKVVRGGCFSGVDTKKGKIPDSEALAKQVHPFMRSASRYRLPPDLGYLAIVGFRVVLAPEGVLPLETRRVDVETRGPRHVRDAPDRLQASPGHVEEIQEEVEAVPPQAGQVVDVHDREGRADVAELDQLVGDEGLREPVRALHVEDRLVVDARDLDLSRQAEDPRWRPRRRRRGAGFPATSGSRGSGT